MDRRRALAAFALFGLLTGHGYAQGTKVFRVGVLRPGSAKEPASVQREPFERGLRELGWIVGSNVLIDYRYGEGDDARLPRLAADLVAKSMDVIVVTGPPAANAVRAASPTIPIVLAASADPVAEGFALDLARPGKNATGIYIFSRSRWTGSASSCSRRRSRESAALPCLLIRRASRRSGSAWANCGREPDDWT